MSCDSLWSVWTTADHSCGLSNDDLVYDCSTNGTNDAIRVRQLLECDVKWLAVTVFLSVVFVVDVKKFRNEFNLFFK